MDKLVNAQCQTQATFVQMTMMMYNHRQPKDKASILGMVEIPGKMDILVALGLPHYHLPQQKGGFSDRPRRGLRHDIRVLPTNIGIHFGILRGTASWQVTWRILG